MFTILCYKSHSHYVFTSNQAGKENSEIACTASVWCDFLLFKTVIFGVISFLLAKNTESFQIHYLDNNIQQIISDHVFTTGGMTILY